MFKTDKKLIALVHAMEKAFEFINNAQSLRNKAQHMEQTIIELLKQITECCLFVRQYTGRGFAGESTHASQNKRDLTFKRTNGSI